MAVSRKPEFLEQVRANLGDMADFSIDRHFLTFLVLTTAR
jgi:hypothetical protein